MIGVAQHGEAGEKGVVGGHATRPETTVEVDECVFQYGGYLGGGERFEAEEVAAREERRIDVETRVVGGGADEADVALFDIRQEEVLLGFVEAVQFVDEENRRGLGTAAGGGEDLPQFGDV